MLKSAKKILAQPAVKIINTKSILAVFILTLLTNVLILAMPLYFLQVYDRVLLSKSIETLIILTFGVGLVLIFNTYVEKARSQILVRLSNKYELDLSSTLFNTSVIKSAYFNDVSTQFLSDLRQVKNFIVQESGIVVLFDAPWSVIYISILFFAHPYLGMGSLFFTLLLLGVSLADESMTSGHIDKMQDAVIVSGQQMSEILMSSHVIESMGMRKSIFARWSKVNSVAMFHNSVSNEISGKFTSLTKFIRFAQTLTMTFLGVYLMTKNEITLGAMIVAGLLAGKGTAPLEMFIMGLKNFKLTMKALGSLNNQITQTAVFESSFSVPITNGSVALERVVYAPAGTDIPTLKGISFAIEAGSFLGIIGQSGSGKSTVAKLVAGLYKPYSGFVRVDGADMNTLDREKLGVNIGYLPQDVTLFEGTIKDNIARFTDASDEEILAAAHLANVHEMILKLPNGYMTNVGSRGMNLSGGQRQKIAIARAVFRNPKIVILDEPNSALDYDNELLLIQTLAKLKENRVTLIVISHKPSLIGNADKLLVINSGVIDRFGNYQDIIASYKG